VNYKYITHRNLFQWTIITGNHSSLSTQKAANLCLKCTEIRLAAGLRLDTLGEFMRPQTRSRNVGLLLRGWRGGFLLRGEREGQGPSYKERREERGAERERKGISPEVNVSGVKH